MSWSLVNWFGPVRTATGGLLRHKVQAVVLGMVLLGTGLLAAGGALGLTILGPWIIRLIYSKDYVSVAAAVLPWYAWAMVPLSLAYALINNLLARSQFRIVPVLLLLAVAYGVALTRFHDTQITVLKTLGVFNLLLLGASTWFTLRSPKPEPEARA